ncbi:hypothetical protein DTL21_19345 [Bremerella cremea]|uniref:Uncharacterized protein n=1 Tax=Blastopirellula marina TaxID=124 RepID=A0A2S8FJM6_9BACT|nr:MULTISPECIES: hypothetical protein [Pirellulaceae]PQO32378.1 hypothetical protein C5Y83_19325 [Blastopirellula marina]RCS45445.1 hypothetical protein DTL21_19345 [Bremerella cremea]
MTADPDENPFASPQVIEEDPYDAHIVGADGETIIRNPPPNSLVLAWILGVALCPIKFISLAALGPCGLIMIAPLMGVLGYMLTPRRWVMPFAVAFFLADAGLLGIGILTARSPTVALVMLIGVIFCLINCGCLFQRSALDYYHRPAT